MSVTVTRDRVAQALKSIRGLEAKQVLVGVPSSTATRDPDPDDPQPINNAAIGKLMEDGSPAQNIPARAHLRPGVDSVRGEVARRYKAGAKAVLDGRIADIDTVHTTVGLLAEAAVKHKIEDGPFIPLNPATLAKRRARGRTGVKPLIDTTQYRNSITFVIRPKR